MKCSHLRQPDGKRLCKKLDAEPPSPDPKSLNVASAFRAIGFSQQSVAEEKINELFFPTVS